VRVGDEQVREDALGIVKVLGVVVQQGALGVQEGRGGEDVQQLRQ
jgi:hypothetical protein